MILALLSCTRGTLQVPGLPPQADAPDEPTVQTADVPSFCDGRWPTVRISEVAPGNVSGIRDEDDDTSDWLELVALEATDLSGWSVDAGDDRFPLPDLALDAGELLFVWASGKDRTGATLHANFRLDAAGEDLVVRAPDLCPTDSAASPFVPADFSWGRPEGEDDFAFFLEPTPGEPNTTESRPGFAPVPVLDPASGFGAVTVAVSGAGELYVTFDSSTPEETSTAYVGAIDLVPPTGGFAVLRARAFVDGSWPSVVATGSWGDPGVLASGLTVLSLVVDPPDLWSDETGIWTFGPPDYTPYYPYFGANFWEDWERDLHLEAFGPDGTPLLGQDAGISIHGGYSRAFDQRGLTLIGRDEYGDSTLDQAFFADESFGDFRTLQLHNGGDWCGTHLYDAFISELLRDEQGLRTPSLDAQAWEPVAVWLDGEYWGLYSLRERIDEHFVAHHHPVDAEVLDRLELGAEEAGLVWRVEQGTWDAFDAFNASARSADLSDPAAWAQFEALAEPESFAAYVVAETYASNSDWWWNNVRMWRPATPEGRFRWILHDPGHGFPDPTTDHFGTSVTWSGDGLPIADALESDAFRTLLANTAADWLSTLFEPTRARLVFDAMADRIEPEIPGQLQRWCTTDVAAWEASLDWGRQYIAQRPSAMDAELMAHLGISAHATLGLDAVPVDGGTFDLTAVDVSAPFTGRYYQDVPVTVTALPAPGFTFAGWSDGTPTATRVLPMDGDTAVTASFE